MLSLILNISVLGFTTIISILSVVALIFIYLDAKQKQKNAILWLLLALFLGYIPIIVYVLKDRKKDIVYPENIKPIYYNFLKVYSILYILYFILLIIYFGFTGVFLY